MDEAGKKRVWLQIRREVLIAVPLALAWHFIGDWSWLESVGITAVMAAVQFCVFLWAVRHPRQAKRLSRPCGRHE